MWQGCLQLHQLAPVLVLPLAPVPVLVCSCGGRSALTRSWLSATLLITAGRSKVLCCSCLQVQGVLLPPGLLSLPLQACKGCMVEAREGLVCWCLRACAGLLIPGVTSMNGKEGGHAARTP